MKKFYLKSLAFWFVLLGIAFINGIIRETTYKPLLTPYIGIWAHQISSATAIILFFIAIYLFLKNVSENYSKKDLLNIGLIWLFMTIIFETFMSLYLRKISFSEILKSYYFWQGETWIFVLISLLILPFLANQILKTKP